VLHRYCFSFSSSSLEALFLFQFPIYGLCLTIEQAYKKNLVHASAKAFQGEDAVKRSCQRPRNLQRAGRAAGNSIVED
jgi:hypothetical protein